MTYPMYFFSEDFLSIREFLDELPTKEFHFKDGDYLWKPGDSLEYIHYIECGLLQFSINHPTGHCKLGYITLKNIRYRFLINIL